MKEFRVVWIECPTSFNPRRVLFIEAASEEDARKLCRNHVERTLGIGWMTIAEVSEVKPCLRGGCCQMSKTFTFLSHHSIPMLARLVCQGDRWGRNGCFEHTGVITINRVL